MAKISIFKKSVKSDQYFNDVSLLLPFNYNFQDDSVNNLAITNIGDVQISNLQSKFGAGSAYFDGNGDYLQTVIPNWSPGASGQPFTIELWIYKLGAWGGINVFLSKHGGVDAWNGTDGLNFNFYYTGSILYFQNWGSNATQTTQCNIALPTDQWIHLAVVYDGTNTTIYVDGAACATSSASYDSVASAPTFEIGSQINGSYNFNGYIDDLRITKNVARYTSSFTPEEISASKFGKLKIKNLDNDPYFDNVSLLLPFDNNFQDLSKNNFIVNVNGNVQISNIQSKYGGSSAVFDGSDDYLEVLSNNDFNFGTNNFTVEAWIYLNSIPNDYFIASANEVGGFFFGFRGGPANNRIGWGRSAIAWDYEVTSGVTTGQWYHVAVCRNGTDMRLFVDGNQVGITQANSTSYNLGLGNLAIGAQNGNFFFNGYIDELTITKGVARYTSNFVPKLIRKAGKIKIKNIMFPIENLIAFWKLDNLLDSSGNNNTLINTNAIFVSGKVGDCAEFDGTGNTYLTLNSFSNAFNTSLPYTVSLWYNITTLKNYFTLIGCSTQGTFNVHGFANGDLAVNNSVSADASVNGFFTTGSWNHIVITRNSSGNIKIWQNGIKVYDAPAILSYGNTPFINIGYLAGYGNGFATDGKIDSVGIWSVELTDVQINQLYNNGNGLEI